MSGSDPIVNDRTICSSIQYSKYGNPTFSAFVFAFTIMYLCLPMFSNGAPNFWVFSSLLVYFFLDMFIKMYKKCVIKMGDLFLNVLMGSVLIIIALIIALWVWRPIDNNSLFTFMTEDVAVSQPL